MTFEDTPEKEVKGVLREYFFQKRSVSPLTENLQASLRNHLLQYLLSSPARKVALTWPLKGEVDLRPIFKPLLTSAKTILLPKVIPSSRGLAFYPWSEHSKMIKGELGTMYPHHFEYDRMGVAPDIIVVPCLAFDKAGYRIGYGKGCYDRALSMNQGAQVVGYCERDVYQEFLPREAHDVPIRQYCTPSGVVTTSV